MNNHPDQIPEISASAKPYFLNFEEHLLTNQNKIENWLRKQWRITPPPVYSSVDLRNAGLKLTPVDTNLFPAGFNNLNPSFLPLAVQAAQAYFEQLKPGCARIVIVPENHTRNPFYFESVITLQDILKKAGFEVRIGSLLEGLQKAETITLASGKKITLEPLIRNGNRLGLENFSPCIVLLNNDLASGIPEILKNTEQVISPPLHLGWSTRLKSVHFLEYTKVAEEFGEIIDLDPWFLYPLTRRCENVNFMKREGEKDLVEQATQLLADIQKKYDQYSIKQKPYVVIKAETGTYGMGVLMINSPEEIPLLNRKKRSEMAISKGNREIREVILQEGVYTSETWKNAAAEPVVYMLGQYVIGGFYRVHTKRGVAENLNAPGMHFVPLAFSNTCNVPQLDSKNDCVNRFYSYGVVARLALVAAAREMSKSR